MKNRIRLPKREYIKPIGREDPLAFYYRPVTGTVYKKRLLLACELLGPGPFGRILDAGYGSGIFLPELSTRSKAVFGLDVHDKISQVRQMLALEGVQATLVQGSVLEIPWPKHFFDAIICLSLLEHLTSAELPLALSEFARVARPDAYIVLGFPVRNVVTDSFFRAAGFRPREIHPSSHRHILKIIPSYLRPLQCLSWPTGFPLDLSLYVASLCRI